MAPVAHPNDIEHGSAIAMKLDTRLLPRDYCWGGPPWCRGGPYLSGGAIAAIVLGVVFFVAIICCICWTYTRRSGGGGGSGSGRYRAYYAAEQTAYTQPSGVRGGGISDFEVSDFSGPTRVTRVKKAKTKRHRHSRR